MQEALILDAGTTEALIADRRRRGIDHHDEVWEGVYHVAPLATNEHQRITTELTRTLLDALGSRARAVLAGANVSDRAEGWEHQYRCPDVVVVLPDSRARDAGTHYVGGPDLLVEVVSPGDRSRDKLGFYASIEVREVLLVERDSKTIELYRLAADELGQVPPDRSGVLRSEVLELELRSGEGRIELRQQSTGRVWTI